MTIALNVGPASPATAERLELAFERVSHQEVSLIVSTSNPQALRDVQGVNLRTCRGGLCTATASVEATDLEILRRHTLAITVGGRRRPLLERSLDAAGVNAQVRNLGLTGDGVLLIFVDSGIDWRHDAFAQPEGGQRIEWLIDLSREPNRRYPDLEDRLDGAVWSRADIEAHLQAEEEGVEPMEPVLERDTYGHGTHVAAIAAGRRGVAPGASIIAIRASREEWPVVFEDADVLDAARAGFDLADALGRPAVLVLALGGHEGPHDGTSLLEQGLVDLVGPDYPGRAIVVAAGNSGGAREHASGELRDNAINIVVEVPSEDESLAVDVDLWSPLTTSFEVSVTTPKGETFGPVDVGEERSGALDDAWISIDNAQRDSSDPIADQPVTISLRNQLGSPIAPGQYRLTIRGRGRFDGYLTWGSRERSWGGAWFSNHLDPDGTLTVPGTAPELLVVGASVSRVGWTDESGRLWRDDRYELGGVAPYSGSGPTRGGALLPQLVAPGHVVVAAMSADAEAGVPGSVFTPLSSLTPTRSRVVPGGERAVLWGTSMAAPHVAGVVALLLQIDPELTQDEIRLLLIASARVSRGADGRVWNPRWGWGELDGLGAIQLLREGLSASAVDPGESAIGVIDDVVAPDECTTVTIVPRDSDGRPLDRDRRVEVHASSGLFGTIHHQESGSATALWCPGETSLGAHVEIEAEVDGVVLDRTARVSVAENRSRLGGWANARGGCSASTRPLHRRWERILAL